jgi:hypothetical protein
MVKANSRRVFLKEMLSVAAALLFARRVAGAEPVLQKTTKDPICTIYRAINGKPGQNMAKVVDLLGGIERVVGENDIVLIKPNVQWWNQGAPNLQALKTFVELIMNRPGGFSGEVVIAENCHRGPKPWQSGSSGWPTRFARNGDLVAAANFNDLSRDLKQRYGDRFSKVHWIDVDEGGKRVFSPADGCGYVYCDGRGGAPLLALDNGLAGKRKRAVVMTYPIFKTDRGTVVDFKNGTWEKGAYTRQPLRFINFAALNHHSAYCGATSALKNYLGISDLSGGPDPGTDGRLTGDYFNFHSFPFDKWSAGPRPGMIGVEIGYFMNSIRQADLNITTAEWVGIASRTEPPVAHTRAVMASVDPVALDYHATKYLLFANSRIDYHNPANQRGPLYHDLKKCAEVSGHILDENKVKVISWDFKVYSFQGDGGLVVSAPVTWGSDWRILLKYGLLRWAPWLV